MFLNVRITRPKSFCIHLGIVSAIPPVCASRTILAAKATAAFSLPAATPSDGTPDFIARSNAATAVTDRMNCSLLAKGIENTSTAL